MSFSPTIKITVIHPVRTSPAFYCGLSMKRNIVSTCVKSCMARNMSPKRSWVHRVCICFFVCGWQGHKYPNWSSIKRSGISGLNLWVDHNLPMHVLPSASSEYPARQSQLKLPLVFTHLSWQLPLLVAHSSISDVFIPDRRQKRKQKDKDKNNEAAVCLFFKDAWLSVSQHYLLM